MGDTQLNSKKLSCAYTFSAHCEKALMARITETGVEILTRPPVSSSKNKKKKKKNTSAAANGNATGTSTPEVGTPTTEAAAGVNALDIVE